MSVSGLHFFLIHVKNMLILQKIFHCLNYKLIKSTIQSILLLALRFNGKWKWNDIPIEQSWNNFFLKKQLNLSSSLLSYLKGQMGGWMNFHDFIKEWIFLQFYFHWSSIWSDNRYYVNFPVFFCWKIENWK